MAAADATPYDTVAPPAACAVHEPYGEAAAPAGEDPQPAGPDATTGGETTHISVVDDAGNAVALTQTNSTIFGSGARVAGFFLNDSGFLFDEAAASTPTGSTWRTRTSTIAPTIVLEDGRVKMVVGAPGSGRIPPSIVQTLAYVLDYGMDPLDAVRMPRVFPSPNTLRPASSRYSVSHSLWG